MVALLNYEEKKALHHCGIYCTNNDNNSYKNDQRLFNVKTLKVNIHWGRLRVSQHIRSVRPLWTWEELLPCDGFVSCVLFCPNWLRYCNEVGKSVHPQCKLILNCEGNLRKQGLHLRRRIFRRVLRIPGPYTHSHGESWGMHLPMRGTFTCDAHDTPPTMTKYCL